ANLHHIAEIHLKRKELTERYDAKLRHLSAAKPIWHPHSSINYAYYPLVFKDAELMHLCMGKLQAKEIFTRRYFYPSLANTLPYLDKMDFEVTDDIVTRILCLPLYFDLSVEEVDLICRILLRAQN